MTRRSLRSRIALSLVWLCGLWVPYLHWRVGASWTVTLLSGALVLAVAFAVQVLVDRLIGQR